MGLEEVLIEIKNLGERIDLIDGNLKFNITLFIGLLTLSITLAGWALSLFTKSIIEKSTSTKLSDMKDGLKQELDYEIKSIKDEVYELKNGLDQRTIELIDNRSKIRWALGTINNGGSEAYVGGLRGVVDWESPITNVRIRDTANKSDISFELMDKGEQHFTFKITQEVPPNSFEWIIVWYDKSN